MNPQELLEGYRRAHGHPTKAMMTGTSIRRHPGSFKAFCSVFKPKSVLDYGCGKGYQYTEHKIHEEANIPMPTLYDPAVRGLHIKPTGQYDSVICTDVMEHIHPDDCDATLTRNIQLCKTKCIFYYIVQSCKETF